MKKVTKKSLKQNGMSYLTELMDQGYKYVIMLKDNFFWATKANMKKDGTFRDNSIFNEFALSEGEQWLMDKKTFIKIGE